MKRMIHLFGFLLLLIVLSGCVSIPFGDKVMEISTDGIEFIDDEEEADAEANAESEAENQENESASEEEDSGDNGNAEDPTDAEEANSDDDASGTEACEEGDVSDLTDNMDVDFYIPDCTVLTSISSKSDEIRATLKVTGADWEEVHNGYTEFFDDKLESDSKNMEGQSTELRAHLYDDESAYTRIKVSQEEEHVEVHILHYFP